MKILQCILLGIVQGLTEFLPVSSSGHLALFHRLLGFSPDLAFDVAVHLATTLAVILYFRKDIADLLRGKNLNLLVLIFIGSIPAALMAFLFKDHVEAMFSSLPAVAAFLALTGALLLAAERTGGRGKDLTKMTSWQSLLIGVAQGFALAPGLSRSGATISAGLALGLERPLAVRFSFLLSIPAVLGATLLELKDIISLSLTPFGFWSLVAGSLSAFFSAYLAIKFLMAFIQKSRLSGFAYYCFALSALILLLGR